MSNDQQRGIFASDLRASTPPAHELRRSRRAGSRRVPSLPSVLFLADHLGHPGGAVHGVTVYLLQVLPALQASGVRVTACFLREPHPAAAQLREHGIEAMFLSIPRLDPRVIARVARVVERGHYDILHATQFKSSVVARLLAHRAGCSAIVHVHDMTVPPLQIRLLGSMIARDDDSGICTSWATRDLAVHGYRLRPDRVRVIHPGVDTAPFRGLLPAERERMRSELGIAPDAPVLGMVARFYPVKGHRGMLRIFAQLVRRMPQCVLVLAGDGPERGPCETLASALGVAQNVRFLGNRADVPQILTAADVVVVPSLSEGLGLAAVEANLCGRPVVAYRTGGLPEVLVDEACGRLVPPGDEAMFVQATLAALRDERHCSTRLAAARQRSAAERFGLGRHVRLLREFYGEVCA